MGLLLAMILSTARRVKKKVLSGDPFGILLFTFFVMIVFYNWTEATLGGVNLFWIILLIAAMHDPCSNRVTDEDTAREAEGYLPQVSSQRQSQTP